MDKNFRLDLKQKKRAEALFFTPINNGEKGIIIQRAGFDNHDAEVSDCFNKDLTKI